MDENIKKQLDDVCNIIDEKLEKSAKSIKDNVNSEVDTVIKGEVKNLVEKHSEIVERLDKIEVENKKDNFSDVYKTKSDVFGDAIEKSESFQAMRSGNSNNASLDLKADVLISSDFAGASSARDATGVERVAGIKRDPSNVTNMMNIIPVASTTSNVIRYVKESAYTDNASNVAEGSAPSDSEFQLTATDAVVQKTSAVMTISQEMLDDTPALQSYLSQRIPAKIMTVVDDQLLNGSGSSPNQLGLMNGGTTFSAGGFANAIESAQELDVLIVALNQLALANYAGNGIILNPTDFHKIYLLKDTTNEYLRGNSVVTSEGFTRINGVPVYLNNKMASGSFVVGDFSQGSQVFQRENLTVDFGYENNDNFDKYLVSVRGIIRMAHAIYLPNAFVKGSFSTAKTALETS
jgi:HK97 family phage major capsid protein|tara:strand:+ start:431 stop:1648 length:1218 start_codon:yes stop_codon:yes gene_type:complete